MDMGKIKAATLALLYVEPEPAGFGFVHHPFFQSEMVYDGKDFVNLFDDVDAARKPYDELIERAKGLSDVLCLVRDPYKMLWFWMCAPFIDDPEQYADVLKHCWVSEEWPSRDVNVNNDMMVELFEGADRDLMVPAWVNEQETVRVYRGVNRGGSPYGMSWTLVHSKALWFAERWGEDGQVYELEAPSKSILAYIEERGENEVVIDAREFEGEIKLCAEW